MAKENQNTAEPEITEQTSEEFEKEFDLTPNEGSADEGEVDEDAILARTDELIEMEEDSDNLERVKRQEAKKKAEESETEDEDDELEEESEESEEDDEEEDEGELEDEEEFEEEDEEEFEEEDEEDDEDTSPLAKTVAGLSNEGAAALATELFDQFGDDLVTTYKDHGEEKQISLAELKRRAAGYSGEQEVDRMAEENKQIRSELQQATQQIQQQYEALKSYLTEDDPGAFISDVVLPNADPEWMRSLRDQLDDHILRIERDPMGFESTRKVARLESQIGQLMEFIRGGGQTPNGGPAAEEDTGAAQPTGEVPDDFGYIPGQGYPQEFVSLAGKSLKIAARAAGIPHEEVLDEWEQGDRHESPFDVLERMTSDRYVEADKASVARRNRGRRKPKRKKGGVTVPKENESARKPPKWDDIEAEVAKEVAALDL